MKKLFTTPVGLMSFGRAPYKLQNKNSNYVALCGPSGSATIMDRYGVTKLDISVPSVIVDLSWNNKGDVLAIICESTTIITFWNSTTNNLKHKESGIKDTLTVATWSKQSSILAIGSSKGNLTLYDYENCTKVTLLGKHVRKIVCAEWNADNILALAGEDKAITINSQEGDLIKLYSLRESPSLLQFWPLEEVNRDKLKVSCLMGSKCLYVIPLNESEKPFELAFQPKYGDIVAYQWCEDGKIMVGFNTGYFVMVSSQTTEVGKELYQVRDHKDGLCDIALSSRLNRCATAGEFSVKIHELPNVRELLAIIELEEDNQLASDKTMHNMLPHSFGKSCHLQWSEDGVLLAVSTPRNLLHVFLSQLPMVESCCVCLDISLCARLTSLLEVTIEPLPFTKTLSAAGKLFPPKTRKLNFEPSVIALGTKYLLVARNTHAAFYLVNDSSFELFNERQYPFNVVEVQVNENYAAALGDNGQILLHWIDLKTFPNNESSAKICIGNGHFEQEDEINSTSKEEAIFPDAGQRGAKITGFQLTGAYLIYATDVGEVCHFYLDDWTTLSRYKHTRGISFLATNPKGTRVVFGDSKGRGYFYNPVIDHNVNVPNWPSTVKRIIWDSEETENSLFVVFDESRLFVYKYFAYGRIVGRGAIVERKQSSEDYSTGKLPNKPDCLEMLTGECRTVGIIRIPHGHLPISICSGEVCFLSPSGRLTVQYLSTHNFRSYSQALSNPIGTISTVNNTNEECSTLGNLNQSELQNLFDQAMRAGCLDDAWTFSNQMGDEKVWNSLGMTSLSLMRFDIAIKCFRKLNHPGLVTSVERIKTIEDEFLLAGYITMIMNDFDQAQEFFLMSTKPRAALEMRRDLLHWEAALQLAKSLAPNEIPAICREYAVEMECIGDYVNALLHFERALSDFEDKLSLINCDEQYEGSIQETLYVNSSGDCSLEEHVDICRSGIARNALRLGDWKRGIQLAKECRNPTLMKCCADILEQMKQLPEAAKLYELSGSLELAVAVYLRCKDLRRAGELLRHITNAPRLQLQYAKARESEGAYKEAVVAYEAARDWDSVVRLQLDKLGNVEEAVRIVQETKSVEGAKLIAYYFIRTNDHCSAIRFLVLSKCPDEAFQLARKHKKMEIYAEAIGSDASTAEYQSIACYFENEKNWYLAGKFYLMAKQYEKAIQLLLRTPYSEDNPALDLALEAVGQANESRLTHLLLVYLMGEADGVPKDARHLFRLYMVLKQYKEAARTAVIIAREEQTAGNYRSAHDLLFNLVQELRQRDLRVPAEMTDNLALLHSYILAKLHVKLGNHVRAAKLLLRVAENISKFPAHIVPILTSTVIECQKAGLKSESFGYAAMLLRPEYRDKLDPKHRRKFETLIRRSDRKKADDTEAAIEENQEFTACPLCSYPVKSTSLYCTECRNNLPYCIITGTHAVKNDFTMCPSCKFPAIYSEFMRYLESSESPSCPMCSALLSRDTIRRISDPTKLLTSWIHNSEDDIKQPASGGDH